MANLPPGQFKGPVPPLILGRRLRHRLVRTPPVIPPQRSVVGWRYFSPKDLRKFKNLFFLARTVVEGTYAGRHHSPYRGSAPEFTDYREYHPGDDLRSVDWKAFARTDRHYVKLFEKETDMETYLLVDCSASMNYGGPRYKHLLPGETVSKLEYAFRLAATLSYLMIKQGDRVGLGLFDERLRLHIRPGGTFPHLYRILNVLEHQQPGRATAVARALREAHGVQRRRGLLVVISDFCDDPKELFAALNMYRHRRFEVILFHVLHEYEYRLPPLDNVTFIDAETGEEVRSRPADIAEAYERRVKEFSDTLRGFARSRGMEYHFLNTETPYEVALEKYLLRRSSR